MIPRRHHRRLAVAVVIAGLVAVVAAGGGDAPAPEASSEERPAPPTADAPDALDVARAEARARARLDRLLDRAVGETRLLEVTVTDCARAPAEGADVVARGPDGQPADSAVADAAGIARLRVPNDVAVTAFASRGDHEGGSAASRAAAVAIGICPGATVLGRVLDRGGAPAPGTRVVLGEGLDEAEADEAGEFVLTDVELLATGLSAEGPAGSVVSALSPPLRAGESREVTLRLEVGQRLVGWVVDHRGDGVVRAQVTARSFDDRVVGRTSTDRYGRFWLRELPPGGLTLVAESARAGVASVYVPEDHGPGEVVITLAPAGLLRVDLGGHGAARVVAGDTDERGPTLATVASGGAVSLPAPATYDVLTGEGEAERLCGHVLLLPGAEQLVRCGAPGVATVVAKVVAREGGAPLAGIPVVVAVAAARYPATSDASGRVRVAVPVERTEVGLLRASSWAGEWLPGDRRNVPLVPGETTDLGDIGLDPRSAGEALRAPGPYGGIGGMLANVEDGIALERVVAGGPLDAAGAVPGDVITAIGDAASGYLPATEAVRLLRGEAGSRVKLRLRGADGRTREVELEREVIDVEQRGWVD